MRPTSSRLRFGGAIAITTLSVLGLGGTAFGSTGGERADHQIVSSGVVDAGDNQHPSGNDRSVENGASGNQGNATSEPDQNGSGPERDNGGIDKPGGPGGTDLADQDGNNGCGNDDDFEDDNEGLCGGRHQTTTPPPVVDTDTDVEVDTDIPGSLTSLETTEASAMPTAKAVVPAQVLGVTIERNAAVTTGDAAVAAPATTNPAVLGVSATRGAALARTGFGVRGLVLVAAGLLLVGFAMVRRPRRAGSAV